jgi:cobalamin biosynthesis Co2+ chelatase CbiK
MKIRIGFVSNSSASSFIIGLAIIPKEEIHQYEGNKNVFKYDFKSGVPYPLIEYVGQEDSKIVIESFPGTTVKIKVKDGDWVLWLSGTTPGILNEYKHYDVCLDDFNSDDIKTYLEIIKLGGQVSYGS